MSVVAVVGGGGWCFFFSEFKNITFKEKMLQNEPLDDIKRLQDYQNVIFDLI